MYLTFNQIKWNTFTIIILYFAQRYKVDGNKVDLSLDVGYELASFCNRHQKFDSSTDPNDQEVKKFVHLAMIGRNGFIPLSQGQHLNTFPVHLHTDKNIPT